jgi:signal recognition particle subunit SRP68
MISNRLRCTNIAHSHAILSNTTNVLQLLLRAQSLLNEASKTLSSPQQSSGSIALKFDVDNSTFSNTLEVVNARVYQYQGLADMQLQSKGDTNTKNKVKALQVIDRPNEYFPKEVDLTNIITYPPRLQPVPTKPLFLDLAWNYIEYPGRGKEATQQKPLQVDAEDEKKPAKKGWFGFGR